MKVFVTGALGQLGRDTVSELCRRGHQVVGSYRSANSSLLPEPAPNAKYLPLDLTDSDAVTRILFDQKPDAVIHCAAWTAVDLAELPENREAVYAVNAYATKDIAAACGAMNCKLIYISTDYVFDGQGTEPWDPDRDTPRPLNVYGMSKLAGETYVRQYCEKHYIVRTSWLYGCHGQNFVKTMLKLSRQHEKLQVVNDQIGTPTYTPHLARLLADMAERERYGTYHAANEGGYISWYAFAGAIFRSCNLRVSLSAVSGNDFCRGKAPRPCNSRLDTAKLSASGFSPLPPWQDALMHYLKQIGE